jgi:aspartate kinase
MAAIDRPRSNPYKPKMPVLVQKYGGTSVGTPERIEAVAGRIVAARATGRDLIVVVSAMGETTDHLLDLARQISPSPPRRELDMLLTAGERISMALLAMALEKRGARAASFTGSQSGILTDGGHGSARISDVRPIRLRDELARGTIIIVAGFQGVSPAKEITTLGRGGSDTTAVALAAAFGAEACEIYTDVAGVFTADPRRVPAARLIPALSYRAMAALAHRGAQVLHARSVDLAAKYGVLLRVRTSFGNEEGTVVDGRETPMEGPHVTGLAHRSDVALVELRGTDTPRDAASAALELLEQAGVAPELLALEASRVERCRLTWIAADADAARLSEQWKKLAPPAGRWTLNVHRGLALVSVVGHALADGAEFSLAAARHLAGADVAVRSMRVDALAVSFVVPKTALESALRVLHAAYFETAASGP